MAFAGKPVRKQHTAVDEAAQSKFKQELTRFEQSIKEMQTCLKSLNETVGEIYLEALPRAAEFQRGVQDEITLVGNFVKDIHEVENQVRRYHQSYNDDGDTSSVASANRTSEFVTSVLGALFKGQNIFFSESSKVSQVLLDIVSQTKYTPTPREVKLTRELQTKIGGKPRKGSAALSAPPPGGVAVAAIGTGGHRGPGALVGGAYGSQLPRSKDVSAQIKPASRFSSPPTMTPGGTRIYI